MARTSNTAAVGHALTVELPALRNKNAALLKRVQDLEGENQRLRELLLEFGVDA